jgi:hypothetical protein
MHQSQANHPKHGHDFVPQRITKWISCHGSRNFPTSRTITGTAFPACAVNRVSNLAFTSRASKSAETLHFRSQYTPKPP